MGPKTRRHVIVRFLEFFFLGLVMGITEDLLAIRLATDAKIDAHVFRIAFLVALPFALVSEVLADFGLFKRLFLKAQEKKAQANKKDRFGLSCFHSNSFLSSQVTRPQDEEFNQFC